MVVGQVHSCIGMRMGTKERAVHKMLVTVAAGEIEFKLKRGWRLLGNLILNFTHAPEMFYRGFRRFSKIS